MPEPSFLKTISESMQKEFLAACQQIESNPNYRPGITDGDLLNLVADTEGRSRYVPAKIALAIQPLNIANPSISDNKFTRVYAIKVALINNEVSPPQWQVNESAVILIKYGKYFLHKKKNVQIGDFTKPMTTLTVEQFLNYECLHPMPIVERGISFSQGR
jgi:hypothetical protein